MDKKQRYRLRQKLQAALCRVVEVVADMMEAGVPFNAENAVTVEGTIIMLARQLDRPLTTEPLSTEPLKRAKKRRLIETIKRKRRSRPRRLTQLPDMDDE